MTGNKSQKHVDLVGPAARVAASAVDTKEANTLLLFPVHREFLAVQVLFHGVGVPDLKVKFSTRDGGEVVAGLLTDELGNVVVPRRVPAGIYVCELEHQAKVHVCTVSSPKQGYVVVLPVGRLYTDVRERIEFVRARRTEREIK